MSDLTADRDWYRRMATAAHKPECQARVPRRMWPVHPDPACPGCNPPADQQLFTQLADQIDAYLAGDPKIVGTPTDDEDQPLNLETL